MKYQKAVRLLVFVIVLLSVFVSSYGIFSNDGQGSFTFTSIFGETVNIYGKGVYQHDSVSMALQAIAQDFITLFLGVPLLMLSFYLSRKGQLKGRLLLCGTLGYFLYTYTSYSFLSMYNSMFLPDVLLMSASFFAFILTMMSFDIPTLPIYFEQKLPVKFIGGFLLFTSFIFGMMWLGKIVPSLEKGTHPAGIDHYTTLVIQALDLAIVVPAGILAGILLIKRRPFGYLLSSVIIVKEITLLTALSTMIFLQIYHGILVSFVMLAIVVFINLVVIYCMVLILINMKRAV
ncbi:hypothetical protein [Neobacillus niacini]|uniref:hypothetical protein n=1 Tax=Neobacillus niacini TaxID=86668 RepID=UPI00285E5CA1|nr:hypothetical protein [Neobacillus niacini]MDR7002864.1 hypothetical protein [Neobacillus niacini]